MNKIKKIRVIILLLLASMLIPGQIINSRADDIQVSFAYLYNWDLATISQDGNISTNEYPVTFVMHDLAKDFVSQVSWAHNDTTIAIGITVNGTGWLGLGMGEVGIGMAGADIIMASLSSDGNTVTIQDMYATKHDDPILDDDKYDFPSVGGKLVNGMTTIEFTFPLASLDSAGNDHFWHVGNEFGFFTAYRKSNKDFTKEHTAHTQSKTVKILDDTYPAPTPVNHTFDISVNDTTGELVLASSITSTDTDLSGHEVGFFQETIFGEMKIQDVFTDSQGYAEVRIPIEKTGDLVFISIFFGDEGHVRSELDKSITIDQLYDFGTEDYHDWRDTVGPRFMRSVMLFGFSFVIILLIYVYATSIGAIIQISKLGKEFDKKKHQKGELTK